MTRSDSKLLLFNCYALSTRVISPGGVTEEIITMEGPNYLEYKLKKGGLPIKDHQGKVTFEETEEEGLTKVTWSCVFTPKLLTGLMKSIINKTFKGGLAAFKTQVEKE